MKTIKLTVLTSLFALLTGCTAVQEYLGPKKLTICTGIVSDGSECPKGFKEVDGSMIPIDGSGVFDYALTCVDYSEGNVTCPKGTKTIVLDFIK